MKCVACTASDGLTSLCVFGHVKSGFWLDVSSHQSSKASTHFALCQTCCMLCSSQADDFKRPVCADTASVLQQASHMGHMGTVTDHAGGRLCIHHTASSVRHGALPRHLFPGGSRHSRADQGGVPKQGPGPQVPTPCGAITCPCLCPGLVTRCGGRQRTHSSAAVAHAAGQYCFAITLGLFCVRVIVAGWIVSCKHCCASSPKAWTPESFSLGFEQQQLIRAHCFAANVKAAGKCCQCLSPSPFCAASARSSHSWCMMCCLVQKGQQLAGMLQAVLNQCTQP